MNIGAGYVRDRIARAEFLKGEERRAIFNAHCPRLVKIEPNIRVSRVGLIAALLCSLFYFVPQMGFGFATPDLWRSLLHSTAAYRGLTPYAELWSVVHNGIRAGLFGPLATLPLLTWLSQPSALAARIIETLGIVLNFGTFYVLAVRLTRSNTAALFAVLAALCSIEFRFVDDPYLTNLFVLPFAAELLLLAFVVYDISLSNKRWQLVVASLSLFACAVMTIPECAVFAVAFVAYIWWAKKTRLALADAIAFLMVAIVTLYLVDRQGIGLFAIGISAFFAHLLTVLPVSYRALSGIIRDRLSTTDRNLSFDLVPEPGLFGWILAFVSAATAYILIALRSDRRPPFEYLGCVVLGGALWICGSLFSAYGSFFAVFGLALVITATAHFLAQYRKSLAGVLPIGIAVILFFVMVGNFRANALVSQSLDHPWQTVITVRNAVRNGLFSGLGPDASVALSTTSPLFTFAQSQIEQEEFLFGLTGTRFVAKKTVGGWLLGTKFRRRLGWTVTLTHLTADHTKFRANKVRLFKTFLSSSSARSFAEGVFSSVRGMSVDFNNYSDTHALVFITRKCGDVQIRDAAKPNSPTYTWSTGFYPFDKPNPIWYSEAGTIAYETRFSHADSWRYARRHANLVFAPDSCGSTKLRVAMTLYSALPGFVDLSGPVTYKHLPVDAPGTPISFILSLPAKRSVTLHFNADTPLHFGDEGIPRVDGPGMGHIHLLVRLDRVTLASLVEAGR
ncbi:MAG: hypothetical protein ACYDA1_01905 [Vulcanimicrobiaceae bacterium]